MHQIPCLSIIHITRMTVMTTPTAQTQRAHSTAPVSMGILEMELTALVSHYHSLENFYVAFLMLFFFLGLIDVNECEPDEINEVYKYLAHNCLDDSNCTNSKGSFYCTCLVGFSGDGVFCTGKLTNIEH